jgi:hypothetical protein
LIEYLFLFQVNMSSQRMFIGAGLAPFLVILLLLGWTSSESLAQPKSGNVVDEIAPDFPALCKPFNILLKDQFSSSVTEVYRAAYERGLKPVAVPFASFAQPIPDDSTVGTVDKWSACVEVAPGTATKAGDDYNLTTLTALRVLRLAVRGPAPGSREPGSAPGACFADPRSPWSPALARTSCSNDEGASACRKTHGSVGSVPLFVTQNSSSSLRSANTYRGWRGL